MKESAAVIAYSPQGAADASSLSLRMVMAAIASGELASVRKGHRRIIFSADLEAYLRSARPAGTSPTKAAADEGRGRNPEKATAPGA